MAPREVLVFMLAAGLLLLWTAISLQIMRNDPITRLRQFGSFWSSGWAANHGLDPYGAYEHVPPVFAPGLLPHGVSPAWRDINLNPPALLPLFRIVALIDPFRLVEPWVAGSACLFILAGWWLLQNAPAPVPSWRIMLLLLATPVRDTIWQAQIYGLMFLCVAVAWRALNHRNMQAAGVAIGVLAAMKPNFLLWPLFLFLAGERRAAAWAAASFAALSLLPALLNGPVVYAQWFQLVTHDVHWMFTTDISLSGLVRRAGNGWLGPLLSGALVLATAILVIYRRPAAPRASVIALAVAILGAPLAWGYYAMVLLPALLDGLWGRRAWLAALFLILPVQVPLITMNGPPWLAFLGTLVPMAPVAIVLCGALRPGGTLVPHPAQDATIS